MKSFFHTPELYFLSHSVGCLPKTTPSFVNEVFFQIWQELGGGAWPGWLDTINAFREEMAIFLNVTQADICPQTNVTSALTKIIYALPSRPKRKIILLTEQDFPTVGFALKQAERAGYELRFVKGDVADIQNWHNAMDDGVQLVHITHALSNTSHLLPVGPICEYARKLGIFSIVDIAQSVGIVPVPLARWQADFATGTSVKFLCGGPGACFLYVAPEMVRQCRPIDVGWFSHENPFELDIHQFRYAPDALRFFGGTPSPAPFGAAVNALQFWQDNHEEAAHSTQKALTHLTDVVPETVLVSPKRAEQRGGTLVLAPTDSEAFSNALVKSGIKYDTRKEGFRFSVHGYTPKDDIEHLRDILKTFFKQG